MKKDTCKCGNEKDTRSKVCRYCRFKEMSGSGNPNYKHGNALKSGNSKTYMIWAQIVQRCTVKTNKQYKDYGGRGIKVCKRWFKFENFLQDMGEKPKGLSLDRINNNKGYSKSNCKWAMSTEQNLNRREIFKNKTSKYKGVYWHKKMRRWCCTITFNKKSYYGGSFGSEKDAYKQYLKLRESFHGSRK